MRPDDELNRLAEMLLTNLARLEGWNASDDDPRLPAVVVRRRALLRSLRTELRGRSLGADGPASLGQSAAASRKSSPDIGTIIATEWQMAKTTGALLAALPSETRLHMLLSRLRDDCEEAALSLRVAALKRPK